MAHTARRRMMRPCLVGALAVLLTACAKDAPQDALSPEGPVARTADNLFRPVFWIAVVIFFLVEGLIVYAVLKFRDRGEGPEPKQIHGNTRLEFGWTLIPALIMLGVAIPTVATIFSSDPAAGSDDVRVKVVARQWWWEYRYAGTDPEVVTANELVIPTVRPVFLELESADVIHSFWVPKLAGKQDVVPERVNTLRLIADEPGTYLGQCAEFCAISHANMRLRVIAKTPEEFDAWLRDQQGPAREPTSGEARRGRDLFFANACIQCHAIRGTDAAGQVGPNLTHFAGRGSFAGSMLETNEQNLVDWIKAAREVKPGVVMPDFDKPLPAGKDPGKVPGFRVLTEDEIRSIVAYMLSLQ